MQATPSSTVAGTWCRKEQFAALRYISRHQEWNTEVVDGSIGLADRRITQDPYLTGLATEAGVLLKLVRQCNARLAVSGISLAEERECSAELGSLRDRSWALLERFLKRPGVAGSTATAGGADGQALHRLKMLEEGAAGWIAC